MDMKTSPLALLKDPTLLKTDALVNGQWLQGAARFDVHDPSNGVTNKATKKNAKALGKGSNLASAIAKLLANSKMGLLAAITITTNTNSGSVKLRLST